MKSNPNWPAGLVLSVGAVGAAILSAALSISNLQDWGTGPTARIMAALWIVQAFVAVLALGYVLSIRHKLPDLDPHEARKALGGVAKWEVGWGLFGLVAMVGNFGPGSENAATALQTSGLLSLLMASMVATGAGEIYANWPFGQRASKVQEVVQPTALVSPETAGPTTEETLAAELS